MNIRDGGNPALNSIPEAAPDGDETAMGEAEAPLIVTTETRANRWSFIGLYLCFGLMFAVLPYLRTSSLPPDAMAFPVFSAIGIFFVLLFVAIFSFQRGTWVLDTKGVSRHPLHGKPQFLEWDAVKRIFWGGKICVLEGSAGAKLKIYSGCLDKSQYRRMIRYIERRLGRDFDLTIQTGPLLSVGTGRFRIVAWSLRMLLLLGLYGAWMSGILWAMFHVRDSMAGSFVPILLVLGFYGPLIAFILPKSVKLKRLNPPWRVRRSGIETNSSARGE